MSFVKAVNRESRTKWVVGYGRGLLLTIRGSTYRVTEVPKSGFCRVWYGTTGSDLKIKGTIIPFFVASTCSRYVYTLLKSKRLHGRNLERAS